METQKTLNANIYTTEQLLLAQKQEDVRAFINQAMIKGKTSRRHGWVMSEIIEEVKDRFGQGMATYAKDYIAITVCGYQI